MAKPLVLSFGGMEIPCPLCKVERSDLYGFVEIETLDEQGRKCSLATLADDGKRVITSGGTAFAWQFDGPQAAALENQQRIRRRKFPHLRRLLHRLQPRPRHAPRSRHPRQQFPRANRNSLGR